ncbi:MAG: alpha/beta hydrolase [Myxococcales bacterium]|nr:alpha/beta hydrolase [Myxococcales bacterium]
MRRDAASVPGPPGPAPYPFVLGGARAWSHDDGLPAGWLHTFDALALGPGAPPRKVHVFLPRDYAVTGPGYPVLYFHDGHTTFWPGGLGHKSWNVAGVLDELWRARAIPELLVVAVEPLDRVLEYTHADWGAARRFGGVEDYARYLAHELVPFVDACYRTRRGRDHRVVVGSSHGGLAAFYVANRCPDVFGAAGCLSSSFWVGLDAIHGGRCPGGPLASSALVRGLEATLRDRARRPRLWLDWGLVRDGRRHNDVTEAAAAARGAEMVALLRDRYGYGPDELHAYEDLLGEHDEVSWGRRLPAVLSALVGTPQEG